MFKKTLTKPDGRTLWLYGRQDFVHDPAPSPSNDPVTANPHMRYHPLRQEWVLYASHRQNRTFMPPPEYNPLAPTRDPENPTELPQGSYDIAVFQNRFPSMALESHNPPALEGILTEAANGTCEVVVFTQDANTLLSSLSEEHIDLLLQVWADRTTELGSRPEIQYVLPFENKGVEVGVTLHHPHGQIYAYPFVPPVQQKALDAARQHHRENGQNLGDALVQTELQEKGRLVHEGKHSVSFIPPFARYPYETWIMPRVAVPYLSSLTPDARQDFARTLKDVLYRLDHLFGRPMPYLMTIHQAPTDGEPHTEWPLRIEIYPALRAENRLKYLAGTELGAGIFANDTLPEQTAANLRAVQVTP